MKQIPLFTNSGIKLHEKGQTEKVSSFLLVFFMILKYFLSRYIYSNFSKSSTGGSSFFSLSSMSAEVLYVATPIGLS